MILNLKNFVDSRSLSEGVPLLTLIRILPAMAGKTCVNLLVGDEDSSGVDYLLGLPEQHKVAAISCANDGNGSSLEQQPLSDQHKEQGPEKQSTCTGMQEIVATAAHATAAHATQQRQQLVQSEKGQEADCVNTKKDRDALQVSVIVSSLAGS